MPRKILRTLHAGSSALGLVTILLFLASTVAAELSGDREAITRVKTGILYGLLVLVPAMAAAGGTGRLLAGRSRAPAIARKMRRMRLIAANAVLVLIPCAVALAWLAGEGRFGAAFAAVQGVELVAGATNLVLMGLNLRDGLAMRAARTGARRAGAPTAGRGHAR